MMVRSKNSKCEPIEIKSLSVEELKTKLQHEKIILADVRDLEDFEEFHLPNSIHIDQYNFNDFADHADLNLPVVICCYRGGRSRKWIPRFLHRGFKEVYNLAGGINDWKTKSLSF